MPRPKKCRRVCGHPRCTRFDPAVAGGRDPVVLELDEYEAIRLIDREGLTHEECAARMEIARTTVTGIYMRARRKIADALVDGRTLLIQGGDFKLCTRTDNCGRGRCAGRGEGCATDGHGAFSRHRSREH